MSVSFNIIYFSKIGNTKRFIEKLYSYANQQHAINPSLPTIISRQVDEENALSPSFTPYFLFIPSYGNKPIDQDDILYPIAGYMNYEDNFRQCLGIIGLGDRSYGSDYCITAHRYSDKYHIPVIGDVELRGTYSDLEDIYNHLVFRYSQLNHSINDSDIPHRLLRSYRSYQAYMENC